MDEKILEHLLGIDLKKMRVLKFFLKNPNNFFTIEEVNKKTRLRNIIVKKYLKNLLKIKFLKTKKMTLILKKNKKRKEIVYSLNSNFPLNTELLNLILKTTPNLKNKILKEIKSLGKVKLAIISGIFINKPGSRIDLFLVGENFNNKRVHNFIEKIESEIGKDINYTIMNTKDFYYRYDMFDRFIRDIFEEPHEILINKLKFKTSTLLKL